MDKQQPEDVSPPTPGEPEPLSPSKLEPEGAPVSVPASAQPEGTIPRDAGRSASQDTPEPDADPSEAQPAEPGSLHESAPADGSRPASKANVTEEEPAQVSNTLAGVADPESDADGGDAADPHDDPHHDDPFHHEDEYHYEYDEHHDPYHDDPDHYGEPIGEADPHESYHDGSYHGAHDAAGHGTRSHGMGVDYGLLGGGSEEEGGGPIKTFLEHLEDLRWVLIRCAAAVMVGLVVCLVAANKLVDVLLWPLKEAADRLEQVTVDRELEEGKKQIYFQLGTNQFRFPIEADNLGGLDLGTNTVVTLEMKTVQVGTNVVLAVVPTPGPPPNRMYRTIIRLINLGPMEGFKVALQVGLYGGLALSSPFLLFFIGHFVLPALHRKEKDFLLRAVSIGGVLFFLGMAFCYFAVVKIVVVAAVHFSNWLNFDADMWRASDYIGVVCKFMLGMGISFELPVVILTLVKLGLLDYKQLNAFRPYWVVVNLVFSSILTPPDPISMVLMALPLQVLYEFSVVVARIWYRRDEAAESSTPSPA